ncbi:hypothetical protein AAG607_09705 [Citromicrobium bathyomarinum]|uniref:hypothetical protein n=1 Tax=Sphingomonadales TaxID=204457 RepID=UPI001A5583B3|nr:hypothetical protein [Citromicrobium sp.]
MSEWKLAMSLGLGAVIVGIILAIAVFDKPWGIFAAALGAAIIGAAIKMIWKKREKFLG